LLKSYSASNVVIKPSKDLNVPFSTATKQVAESTAITVTLKDILVDDAPVITLENGVVPERELQHQGMLIQPLLTNLQSEVTHQKKIAQRNASEEAQFKGMATIISDRYVPATLIMQILYTAGLAEYSKFNFLLVKVERS
jgi:hypothetical protein